MYLAGYSPESRWLHLESLCDSRLDMRYNRAQVHAWCYGSRCNSSLTDGYAATSWIVAPPCYDSGVRHRAPVDTCPCNYADNACSQQTVVGKRTDLSIWAEGHVS
jgi:hypothetical protein